MPLDTALLASQKFRAQLLAKEREAGVRLVNSYGDIWQRLQSQIDLLAADIDAMSKAGTLKPWRVGQLDRLKALQRQVQVEINRYAVIVENEVTQGARAAIAQAQADARALTQAALPGVVQLDAAIMTRWQSLNPAAVESLLGFLQPDSPLMAGMRERFGAEIAQSIGDKLVQGIGLGYNPRKVAAIIQGEMGQGLNSALRLSRTAQLYSYREATRAAYVANGEIVPGWEWRSARDGRSCMACVALDGTRYKNDETLNGHWQCRCLAPGTLVSGPAIKGFVSRRYKGDLLTIRTASGQLLSVTPNHPILTDHGWVAAGLLKEGDNVIRHLGLQGVTGLVHPDEYQMPTRVEDIPRALGMQRLVSMPTAAKDFHGDGEGSDVHVIWANGLLGNDGQPLIRKPSRQYGFGLGAGKASCLASLGIPSLLFDTDGATTAGGLRCQHADAAFFRAALRLLQAIGLCAVTTLRTNLLQATCNNVTGYVHAFRDAVLRFSAKVGIRDSNAVQLLTCLLRSLEPTRTTPLFRQSTNSHSSRCAEIANGDAPRLQNLAECIRVRAERLRERGQTVASNISFDHILSPWRLFPTLIPSFADGSALLNNQASHGQYAQMKGFANIIHRLALRVSLGYAANISTRLLQHSSLSARTKRDTASDKGALDGVEVNAKSAADTLKGLAGAVALDRVVNLHRSYLDGHVYNLQTSEGWFVADGIITHNCTMLPDVIDYADLGLNVPRRKEAIEYATGEDWFSAQPEAMQKAMMGPGKFEAWKEGKIKLSDLVHEQSDPVWGKMRSEASLKGIEAAKAEAVAKAEAAAKKAATAAKAPKASPAAASASAIKAEGDAATLLGALPPEAQAAARQAGLKEVKLLNKRDYNKAVGNTGVRAGWESMAVSREDGTLLLRADNPNLVKTFHHELAHALDPMGADAKYKLSEHPDWLKASGWKADKYGRYKLRKTISNQPVSEYGGAAPWEDFAESFAKYTHGSKFDRRVMQGESEGRYEYMQKFAKELGFNIE